MVAARVVRLPAQSREDLGRTGDVEQVDALEEEDHDEPLHATHPGPLPTMSDVRICKLHDIAATRGALVTLRHDIDNAA
ncbi:hypothetical protein GCM10010503_15920 [Streptomyces lucensis JCM 4490]|uniref:Uncharacterized protein n=1 Tax=Streptomyces lucensis JCM 4490 TaxID=1306176 RepID=A0A918MMA4_9ACTN|nr:hypothetical protein GCM10010503_15920 [Streptomyces lucensis JCM 4490]